MEKVPIAKVSHPPYFQMIKEDLMPLNEKGGLKSCAKYIEDKQKGFRGWVCDQSFPIQAVLSTASGAVRGAVVGAVQGTLAKFKSVNDFIPFGNLGTTRQQARAFSVLMATDNVVSCVMKKNRGKKMLLSLGFAAGVMFKLVNNGSIADAMVFGALFAVWHGVWHEVLNSPQPPVLDDACFIKTRCMLSDLDLQYYEKNFKKNMLMDRTMPYLKDSDLKEAEIPLGARVLILNHIESNKNI
ncbi:chloroplastic import inner membrane translocase subunit HP30-2-like [Papaver somniferum]|uniref:chloroplastic import inner membrane translocase subunit HP30-2-like n=1 Tax=Papaver somniferum TaxID=3469 RepID=UPI000E70069A|nr:chloroplastic import inner membrane translocase subunit HP30-2-like [Papaver somniferum]